jgi:hypothetical protein
MYTLEGFDEEYIKNLYKSVVLYSIKKYDLLPDNIKQFYYQKYQNALLIKEEEKIEDNSSIDDLREFLQGQKEIVENVKNQNQPIINLLSSQVLSVIMEQVPKNLTPTAKCECIFDIITTTMEYSNDWYQYCKSVPPIDGFDFSFYHGVPLSDNYEGLLITRQGIGDDIVNLITYLGKKIGINIGKTICEHNENLHAINYIEIDGVRSYLDATSVILKNKTKEEAFLVSEEYLNKSGDYKFETSYPSKTLDKKECYYNIENIINNINQLMPQVNYIEYNNLKK